MNYLNSSKYLDDKIANLQYLKEYLWYLYDVMKGRGPVSLSAGLHFPYPEKVEEKLETTFYH